jgi:ATP-dependent RNA helicase DeaD
MPAVFARAFEGRGYRDLTPVQEAVLASDAADRDLLVSAQTGSGKTVAYGVVMAAPFLEGESLPIADEPLALIIAPTRELALQVQTELAWLYASTGAEIVACVGGMDPIQERRQLRRGVHIVVGTPGRLRDHMERGALQLGSLKAVVIDEADEMLDLGFHEDLKFILDATPPTRRTFMFSATLPKPIVALARTYQNDAFRIEVTGKSGGHADIEYRAIKVAHPKIGRAVVNLLRYIDPPCALVFCATRLAVQRMGESLASRGFNAVVLSGEMSQNERNRALSALREGRARVCVATDVAARGLDVPNLTLVIHAELPNDSEVLQHRSGRTGRAGNKGVSILLVPPSRRRKAEEMLQRAAVQYVWDDPPSIADILASDRERLLASPLLAGAGDDEDAALAAALLKRYEPRHIAGALAKLYRAGLPAPEDLQEYVEPPHRQSREDSRGDRREDRRDGRRGERSEGPRSRGPREVREPRAPHEARTPHEPRAFERKGPKGAERHDLSEGAVWFRISVGRERNADPKWLLPEICRQGDVTKKDIGEIRIFDTETRFELDSRLAGEFIAKVAKREKGGVAIFPATSGEPDVRAPSEAPRFERKHAPRADRTPRAEHKPAPKPDSKHEKPAGKTAGSEIARYSSVLQEQERKQKRKERKKAKRKLAALAKG